MQLLPSDVSWVEADVFTPSCWFRIHCSSCIYRLYSVHLLTHCTSVQFRGTCTVPERFQCIVSYFLFLFSTFQRNMFTSVCLLFNSYSYSSLFRSVFQWTGSEEWDYFSTEAGVVCLQCMIMLHIVWWSDLSQTAVSWGPADISHLGSV